MSWEVLVFIAAMAGTAIIGSIAVDMVFETYDRIRKRFDE